MTKRIFKSICIVALSVFLFSIGLFMGVLYDYFSNVQRSQLRMQTNLAAQGAANEGMRYFEGLDVTDYRITWIGMDGAVLYDSRSDFAEMENIGNLDGYYITNGKAIKITCEKKTRAGATVYKDSEGNEIEVNDGHTYIQIVPPSMSVTFE